MRKLAGWLLVPCALVASTLPAWAGTLSDRQVVNAIAEAIMVRQHVARKDINVEWDDGRADNMVPALPEGRVSLTVGDNARLGGKGTVPVQVWVDGRKFRTIFPRVIVEVMRRVIVAKAPISRGQAISSSDVGIERTAVVDNGSTYSAPLTNLKAILGTEATRQIAPGTVLTAGMFKILAVVKSGQVVSVLVHAGEVTIIGRGEARSNGGIGQLVKVVNLDSKKEFTAKVTGPNRVEIEMEE